MDHDKHETPQPAMRLREEFNGSIPPTSEYKLQLGDFLNEGGTSFVFLGEKLYKGDMHQTVVVKLAKTIEEITSARAKEYVKSHPDIFSDEARSLLKAEYSSYVVKLYDRGDFRGRPYLVMEYLPQWHYPNLEERLAYEAENIKSVDMSPRSRLSIMWKIASALQSVKCYIFNHRDLKPSNILFTYSEGRVRMCDFQTAISDNEEDWYDGVSFGSSVYSSPEEIRNAVRGAGKRLPTPKDSSGLYLERVGSNADLYALGLVFARISNPLIPVTSFPSHADKCDERAFYESVDGILGKLPDYSAHVRGIADFPGLPNRIKNDCIGSCKDVVKRICGKCITFDSVPSHFGRGRFESLGEIMTKLQDAVFAIDLHDHFKSAYQNPPDQNSKPGP
jgi:serine/threonine protein kinase